MNHNPHNLQIDDTVILDEDYSNSSEVIIVSFTPQQLYAMVREPDDKNRSNAWTVMTNRLTPKKNK